MSNFPYLRHRRLRQTTSIRKLVGQPLPGPEKFIWPIFVIEGQKKKVPIDAMPGQFRYSVDEISSAVEPLAKLAIGGVILFGVLDDHKDPMGHYAYNDNGVVQNAIRILRRDFPDLTIFTDVCLCGYTDHGHCGVLTNDGYVDNDRSLDLLSRIAVSHAVCGAHGVAPSAMMDGQVTAIRKGLDEAGCLNTIIMSYSTKFASALYGPFREAAKSAPSKGTRAEYQASYDNLELAIRESEFDVAEAADILMVKPALFYLDLIYRIKSQIQLPLAAYNVSGEYSMLVASARNGWGDLHDLVRESIMSLSRAGSDILISYWANQYDEIFNNR